MSRPRTHLLLAFCLLALPALINAQEASSNKAQEDAKAVEKQGLELLDTIAGEIPNLRNRGNRIHLMSAVADLLWTRDEKRARALFEIVKQEMVAAVANLDSGDQQFYNTSELLQQRRRECLDRMARRDPTIALAFLRATRLSVNHADINQQANEASLELHLAGLVAAQDPEQALRLGREALRKGVSYSLVTLLQQIAPKNKDLAQTLYREIVDRFRNDELSKNPEAANHAWSLLHGFQPPQANEETYRELVDLLASLPTSAASNPRNSQNYYGQFQALMPQVEKYAPARAPMLRQWLQSIRRTVDPNERVSQELNEVTQRGTVEDILALAAKYGPEVLAQIYQQAAWKASSGGDMNRARQIVSEFIADPSRRRQMLQQLDNQLLWNSVSQNKVDDVRQLLTKVKSVEQRVQILVNLAGNIANTGERKQALDLLAEARAIVDSAPLNQVRFAAQLQLAQGYSSIDAKESIALIQPIVVHINQLVAAAAVLDGFENRYLEDGEWMKPGSTSLGNLVNNLEQNLGMLAVRDADGARTLSDQFERPEIRLMAQLEIVQALLGSGKLQYPRRYQSVPFNGRIIRR